MGTTSIMDRGAIPLASTIRLAAYAARSWSHDHSIVKVLLWSLFCESNDALSLPKGTKMYYTYILQCADKSLYTGSTNNLVQRVKRHNQSLGSRYTQARLPVKLVYYESYGTLAKARKREAQLKRWRKEKKIKLITYGHPTKITKH